MSRRNLFSVGAKALVAGVLLSRLPEAQQVEALRATDLELAFRNRVPDPVAFVKPVLPDLDPWQMSVLRSSASRLLLNCSRQSGKSTTVGALAVHTAVFVPDSLVLLVSPTLRQSGELFRKCAQTYVATESRRIAAPVQSSALQLHLDNGSRIVSLPGKEGTVRGYSGVRLLVIDEAAWVPNDLYIGVRPMLAVSQGRLVVLSTPHGRRGWFWEEWDKGDAWDRYRIPAEECPRIPPEFLAREQRTLGEWWYRQEYGCEFLDAESAPFREADIRAAREDVAEAWDL